LNIVCVSVIEYFQLVKVWKLLGNGKGEEKNVVLSKEIFYYDYLLYMLRFTFCPKLFFPNYICFNGQQHTIIYMFGFSPLYCFIVRNI